MMQKGVTYMQIAEGKPMAESCCKKTKKSCKK